MKTQRKATQNVNLYTCVHRKQINHDIRRLGVEILLTNLVIENVVGYSRMRGN